MGYQHYMLLVYVMFVSILHFAHSSNSPHDYVRAHNVVRKAVGMGPVRWSSKVAKFAESYARKRRDCALIHSHTPKYGENIAWGTGAFTGLDAVKLWADEKGDYNYNSNTCRWGKMCGHYTQMVWKSSVRIGCARIKCTTKDAYFVTCNYDPPGNYIGEKPFTNVYSFILILTTQTNHKMGNLHAISLVLAMFMAILYPSQAHNEPEDFLHAHGCIRRLYDLPPLVWDPELAKTAQAWADKRKDCQLTPSDKVGENMAQGPNLNASYAVQMWVDERPDYDGAKNECLPGTECAHYTQVVWKKTERVGCGRAQCDDKVCYIIVCNYDPPGNVVGEKPM
ncbi:hypothetical protein LXL04_001485 [Taraxacum kok-saghyz]